MSAESALKTLQARSFRVGRICELNDPFEWKLGITGIIPEGDFVAREVQNSLVNDLNAEFGIVCFSDTAAESVLWAHYGDCHRGVAFEVDQWLTTALYRVEYSDERPSIDVNRLRGQSAATEYAGPILTQMLTRKSRGWSYEREYRVFFRLATDCREHGGHYFREIPSDYLKRVILGIRCTLHPRDVAALLGAAGLGDVPVVRARDCREAYKILVEDSSRRG